MRNRVVVAAVAMAFIVSVIVAVVLIINQPEPWRPDQQNWPPAQTMNDPELADMPPEQRPIPQKDVIWPDYRPGFKNEIDSAGDRRDCVSLNDYFNYAASTETRDVLALTYIEKWGLHLGCKEFTEDPGDLVDESGPPEAFMPCEPEGETGRTSGGTKVICKKDGQGTLRWVKNR